MLRAYNAPKHPLSSADIGSFMVAIVEARCLDVGVSPASFSRVSRLSCLLECMPDNRTIDVLDRGSFPAFVDGV